MTLHAWSMTSSTTVSCAREFSPACPFTWLRHQPEETPYEPFPYPMRAARDYRRNNKLTSRSVDMKTGFDFDKVWGQHMHMRMHKVLALVLTAVHRLMVLGTAAASPQRPSMPPMGSACRLRSHTPKRPDVRASSRGGALLCMCQVHALGSRTPFPERAALSYRTALVQPTCRLQMFASAPTKPADVKVVGIPATMPTRGF